MSLIGVPQLNSLPAACRENGTERSVVFSASLVIYRPSQEKKELTSLFPSRKCFLKNFLDYPSNYALLRPGRSTPVTPAFKPNSNFSRTEAKFLTRQTQPSQCGLAHVSLSGYLPSQSPATHTPISSGLALSSLKPCHLPIA